MLSSHLNLQKYIKKTTYKTILTKISYFCTMNERINWIDWGKAMAACVVVLCHVPQSQEWFYVRYIQATIISVFFFISGYLKKDRGSDRANWKKYWTSLIIPYLLYNVIIYPYWLLKYYVANGTMPDLLAAMRPIFGTLLLQHENSFAEPLDGPLWYLPAILMMHVTIDLCHKTKHQHLIMIALCIISFVLYAANKYWYFAPNLTPMGVMRNLPYYYIGYVFGQYGLFKNSRSQRDLIYSVLCLTGSLLFFAWHLNAFYADQHLLHIVLFYPVNIGFLFGVLYGCRWLNDLHSEVIVNLSNGTLVIVGLHIVLISFINALVEHLRNIHTVVCYEWYEAVPLVIIIVALLYPIILMAKKHFPVLLGKKTT